VEPIPVSSLAARGEAEFLRKRAYLPFAAHGEGKSNRVCEFGPNGKLIISHNIRMENQKIQTGK
jgi:hypothetical protein